MSDTIRFNEYKFNVEMSCSGCSGAVERALKKLGIDSVDTNLEKHEVVVQTDKPREEVLAAIKKTGKIVKDE